MTRLIDTRIPPPAPIPHPPPPPPPLPPLSRLGSGGDLCHEVVQADALSA